MVNFKIVENSLPVYLEKYDEFIELYNDPEIPVEEIRRRLGWRTKIYGDARRKALSENKIQERRRSVGVGRPVKKKHEPRYYYYDKTTGKFIIVKRCYDGEKDVVIYYGRYDREDTVKKIVEELKKVNWDKSRLEDIKKNLGLV